ncbi:MAG TPA: trypsin-like peptidase domain-containing protein [Candidatus Tectomicrobia bacterium]|nr:trypsin-like peptidase domain-containing protein [Candidatus Tectomicrobia bacterium]
MERSSSEGASALLALSNDLAGAVERASRSVVAVHARPRLPSSGVHWRPGVIVTADHTVTRDEEISIGLPDGRTIAAVLAGRDASTDLAVLKLQEAEFPAADIGDAASLRIGHVVLAVARPGERGVSASWGVISALDGPWRTWHGGQIDRFIRPDVSLYPGFSGGPLVDAQGQVMGINTSGPRSMVLTIPPATVNRVMGQLLEKGHITRGYLGLGMQSVRLPESLNRTLTPPRAGGVIIVAVEPDSPAERAGLLIGDVLVALDGVAVTDTADVQALLGPERVGAALGASIIRAGTLTERSILIGQRPQRRK